MTSLLLHLFFSRQPIYVVYFRKLTVGFAKYVAVTKEPTDTNTLITGDQEYERLKEQS